MLFDVKGKRKRMIQVVYVILAILFGGSLVLFGTGSGVSGGLVDAITGNSSSENSAFQDQVDEARQAAAKNPKSPEAWRDLARTEFNFAASAEGSDAETGQLSDAGKQAVLGSIDAWERYIKLKPKKVDASTAQFVALAYGATQDYDKAYETQALAVESRPNPNAYYQLAQFAYAAGQVKKGDEAAAESIRRTPPDLRNTVRAQVKQAKKQGTELAKAIKQQEKASKEASKGQPKGTAFGPLPGTTGAAGAAP
jgi:tetratricopeptide (TPR) repeat protein